MTLMVQFHETLDSRKGLHPFWEAARKCAPRRNGLHPFSEAARKFTSCKFPAALLFGANEVLKKTSCLAPKSQSLPKRDAARLGASLLIARLAMAGCEGNVLTWRS